MARRPLAGLLLLVPAAAGATALVASRGGRAATPAAATPDGTGSAVASGRIPTRGAPLTVSGSVTDLRPGTPAALTLTVRNPNAFPVVVRSVTTAVGPPDVPACPGSALDVGTYAGPPVSLRGHAAATVTVRVVLRDSVTEDQSSCTGATFPLAFGGSADTH